MGLETYACNVCGEEFMAHPGTFLARHGYCRPRCISDDGTGVDVPNQ